MQNAKTSNTGYCYGALLQAIDFFTQKFNLDQIGSYAFEFANEMLTLHSSALFVKEHDQFVLKNARLYPVNSYRLSNTQALQELPVLHGDIIIHKIENFFSQEFIETFHIKLVIPLVINNLLHGFIVSNGKILDDFDENDLVIASTLTKLFRNSLENSMQLDELALKNKQLDQKIFNLFAINQSAKSLLSEVDLERLYTLATDIFSEITCSKVTSFGIYDAISKSIKVLGYRNVSNYSSVSTELHLISAVYRSGRVVLDFEKDREIIQAVFRNWEEFRLLDTKYIILLVKEEILGVVTLSEAVNERLYDEATFELVETLASFTHIAISNALLFKKLLIQSERIERKFHTLNTLNKIIQNINRGIDIDELSALTLKVMSLNFGIKKAFFAYGGQDGYTISQKLGIDVEHVTFDLNDSWKQACEGEMVLDFQEDAMYYFFKTEIVRRLGTSNCIVIAPICNVHAHDYETTLPRGFLVVLETQDSLKEEEILLIDTIAKNISPVICQMDLNSRLKDEYKIDPKKQFIADLNSKFKERTAYSLDFNIYYKWVYMNPFQSKEEMMPEGEVCYLIDSYIFVITYEELEDNSFCRLPDFEDIDEVLAFDYMGYYNEFVRA